MDFDTFNEKECVSQSANDPFPCPPETIPQPEPEEPQYDLVLKPDYAMREVGQAVQFKTYLRSEEGLEEEVTMGLVYRSSNTGIAVVGAISGRGFGVQAGIVTVSVEWQDKIAYAQFEVIGDCSTAKVGMMLLIDNSLSMGQVFTETPIIVGQAPFSTKLAFAKENAFRFASEVNETKDWVGLIRFAEGAVLASGLTQDKDLVADMAFATPQLSLSTNVNNALMLARQKLNEAEAAGTINRKVIVIFSDGVNKLGDDPRAEAEAFKGLGGVIVSVGVRAAGDGFALMHDIASEGMFINALKTNATDAGDYLSGAKGYFCAGNCQPQGNVTVPVAELNYADFTNWDVEGGNVDLIGGEAPYDLYDLLPGNGLYVDMAGSGPPWTGKLVSKDQFALVSGRQYRLQFHLAGNQRQDATGYTTRVRVENPENSVDQTITIDDFSQDFTDYSFTFVAPSSANCRISFQQTASGQQAFGNLLDEVLFECLTVPEVLLQDDFDGENQTFIEPDCVSSDFTLLGYGYGYCSGIGCLDDPIPQQIPDPSPQPDIE